MRGAGDILVISGYELGHQPSGLAVTLAFFERAGFLPAALDLGVEKLSPETVRAAKLVLFSVPMHTALRVAARAASVVKSLAPGVRIGFFGLYAHLNAEHLLAGDADFVAGGECEPALVAAAAALEAGLPLEGVDGLSTRARRSAPVLSRPAFPLPSRNALVPLARYAKALVPGKNGALEERTAAYVEATRGCKHVCAHCPITPVYRGRFFAVPQATVLADLDQQLAAGARHVTFGDPDFLNGPKHALALAAALHEKHPAVTFDATIKVEHLLLFRNLLPQLAANGCLFVITAVESLSDTVLGHLKKGHTAADVPVALDALRAAGIAPRPTLLPFTPWSTLDDHLALFTFLAEHRLEGHVDPVQMTLRLLIPPGSAILDDHADAKWLGPLDAAKFTRAWTHPDPRMDALQRDAMALHESLVAAGDAPDAVFAALRAQAFAAAGQALPAFPHVSAKPVPRMTEPWFCCAEPSESQLAF